MLYEVITETAAVAEAVDEFVDLPCEKGGNAEKDELKEGHVVPF